MSAALWLFILTAADGSWSCFPQGKYKMSVLHAEPEASAQYITWNNFVQCNQWGSNWKMDYITWRYSLQTLNLDFPQWSTFFKLFCSETNPYLAVFKKKSWKWMPSFVFIMFWSNLFKPLFSTRDFSLRDLLDWLSESDWPQQVIWIESLLNWIITPKNPLYPLHWIIS